MSEPQSDYYYDVCSGTYVSGRYVPDPELIKEMDATVKIPCSYGDESDLVWRWLETNDITFRFRNQWSDNKGTFASFTIMDERERMWFMLRWGGEV